MALLAIKTVTQPSLNLGLSAVAASDTIQMDTSGIVWLWIRNTGAPSDTVTISDSGKTLAGSSATNPTVVVPTGHRIIPIPAAYANDATGLVTITHSVTASVTCAVIRVP